MKKLITIVAVVLAIAGIGIYKLTGSLSRAGERGDAAVTTFHRDYNGNGLAAIHTAAAPAFRSAVPMEKFTPFMGMLHERLGEWKSGERTSINLKNENGRETLEVSWSSTFANGPGTESFVFDYNGDVPLLTDYHVKSPALTGNATAEGQQTVAGK